MAAIAAPRHLLFKKACLESVKSGLVDRSRFFPHYAWIQDLVSESRSRDELVKELRRNCVVRLDGASHV